MKVRIDGYKHIVNKSSGEDCTLVYYSCEVNRADSKGFIHCSPAWLDDVLDFDCGEFYNLVTDIDLSYGKPYTRVIGFDVIS